MNHERRESMDQIWRSPEMAERFLAGRGRVLPFAREMGEVLLRLLDATGRPVHRFADVGCGAGRIGRLVLDAHPDAEGIFADFSEPMLAAARTALADCEDRVRIVSADFGEIPGWKDALTPHGPFDAVVSGFAIHHLPHERKQSLYAEIFDLLAPGGMFVNIEHVASASPWVEWVHDTWFVDKTFAAGAWEDKTRDEALEDYRHRPDREANILAGIGRQCDWLRQIGFADVDCFFKCFELSVFGGRKPPAEST